MLSINFKLTLRSIFKNKLFNSINIFGLAIGLASCILILLFVTDELSYDRFHTNAKRVYRVINNFHAPGKEMKMLFTRWMTGPNSAAEIPGVENYVRTDIHRDF